MSPVEHGAAAFAAAFLADDPLGRRAPEDVPWPVVTDTTTPTPLGPGLTRARAWLRAHPLAFDGALAFGVLMSAPYLGGASIDFVDTIEKQGFTIDNPNATGSCACGDSFS